jgi:hypothetical protein
LTVHHGAQADQVAIFEVLGFTDPGKPRQSARDLRRDRPAGASLERARREGRGLHPADLEKGAIDPDELGPLEGRASSQKSTEKSEAAEPGTLGAVLEVRNNPGYHPPDQWFEIGKHWLEIARKMNAKRG